MDKRPLAQRRIACEQTSEARAESAGGCPSSTSCCCCYFSSRARATAACVNISWLFLQLSQCGVPPAASTTTGRENTRLSRLGGKFALGLSRRSLEPPHSVTGVGCFVVGRRWVVTSSKATLGFDAACDFAASATCPLEFLQQLNLHQPSGMSHS